MSLLAALMHGCDDHVATVSLTQVGDSVPFEQKTLTIRRSNSDLFFLGGDVPKNARPDNGLFPCSHLRRTQAQLYYDVRKRKIGVQSFAEKGRVRVFSDVSKQDEAKIIKLENVENTLDSDCQVIDLEFDIGCQWCNWTEIESGDILTLSGASNDEVVAARVAITLHEEVIDRIVDRTLSDGTSDPDKKDAGWTLAGDDE